jgi:hypothetical protein
MLKVLTSKLKWVTDIDDFISFQFIKKWHEVGQFELHINRYARGVEELQKNRLIMLSPSKTGIIKHREIQLDEQGKPTENWVFKGYDMKGILGQRITLPPETTPYDNKSGSAETVMKHYVNNNAVNPLDRNRKFIMLKTEEDQQRGNHISWQSRFKLLSDEIKEVSIGSGIGWDISMDLENGWWVFDCIEGKDLTVQNSKGNSPVFFSTDFGNLEKLVFTDSDLNKKNVAIVAGQGEGVDREVEILGDYEDIDRIETFIDARDVEESGNGDNGESLTERGERILSEMSNELYLEGEVLTPIKRNTFSPLNESSSVDAKNTSIHTTFVYEKDWNLGDTVTLFEEKWNVMANKQITEIREIYESGTNFKLEAVFGFSRPTIFEKIGKRLSQYDTLLKQ